MSSLPMDIMRELGPLAFGSRLKRLSDRLMQDGIKIYRSCKLDFEPKWFPVYYYLAEVGPSSVTDIAKGVGITHPSVNQIAKELLARGYLATYKDRQDKRKRVLALSALGKAQRQALTTVWNTIDEVLAELIAESGVDLLRHVEKLEGALQNKSFERRFLEKAATTQDVIRIKPFEARYADDFRCINESWIEEFFELEDADRIVLRDPEGYILSKGGEILFAVNDTEQVVGTCALIRHSSEVAELAKMGVIKSNQSSGAGYKLGAAILDLAVAKGFRKVFLETNSTLTPALRLYQRLGFTQYPFPHTSDYQRADVYMEWLPK